MASRPKRRVRSVTGLDQPYERSRSLRGTYDPERFGRVSERVARYIGSWAFIAWMSVVITLWVLLNTVGPEAWHVDPFPFIFLTLLLSLQASYAAPLILLAQNRQSDRDRVQYQEDRQRTERLLADSDYLAREIAALRLALGEVATRDYIRGELRDMVADLRDHIDAMDLDDPQRPRPKDRDRKRDR
ncbi:MAG: DUF1003 domain-containing protein [Candidatus Nanopelagicales bacterium]|nr:DUF1003 domain-containing protein [Candidatus Nanopelagicales bacterium]